MIKLSQISSALNVRVEGDHSFKVIGPSEPKLASEKQLAIALDKKFQDEIALGKAKVAFLKDGIDYKSL